MALTTTEPARVNTEKQRPRPAPKPLKVPRQKATPVPKQAGTEWASAVKPSLVLLPPKARGLKSRRQAVRRSLVMSVGLAGLTAGAYIFVIAGVAGAQAEVDREASVTASQTKILTQHRAVQEFADGFAQRKAAASSVLDQDISYSRVVNAVQGTNSVGATFTGITAADSSVGCVSPSPFEPALALGCLDLTGKAPSVAAVGQLVAALNNEKSVLTEPYLTEAVSVEGGISFKISVGFTDKALSLKGQKFLPSPDELQPAAPSPSAPATEGVSK